MHSTKRRTMWNRSMDFFGLVMTTTIVLAAVKVSAQDQRHCMTHESCGKCLATELHSICGWCTDPGYDMRRPRCLSLADLNSTACKSVYQTKERPWLIENRTTQDFGASDAVQIQPQRVRIGLKKFETKTVRMVYRPARNYPLDLYYLMDMTHTMDDDKETLVKVGADLAAMLGNLTDNYRVGFGSFVDKPAMPFMSTGDREKDNQCAMIGKICEKTYGFRHSLSLNQDVSRFTRMVNATVISANLDNLEGGLDALMQVIVCEEQIGWLKQSRKIVVFATDGEMHFAGDGLLAGVVRPNDRLCHLSPDGEYLASLVQDYPSLEEMNNELVRRKVSVIFVATHDVQSLYHQIQGLMQEVSSVGTLTQDSSNILELVNEGYANFVRKAHFVDDAPSNIHVRYESRCDGGGNDGVDDWLRLEDSGKCDNVVVGKEYEFVIHLTRLDNNAQEEAESVKEKRHNTIRVEEASIQGEFLQIDVELEDDCPCMQDDEAEGERGSSKEIIFSGICNWHGEFKCGTCLCEQGWLGKTCECDATNYGSSKELEHQCRVPLGDGGAGGSSLGAICSDRGECICGECNCNYGFTGEHCDCKECPYYKGLECGGSERATCDCGQCRCNTGWTGEKCECPLSKTTCTAPSNSTDKHILCSGRGSCDCGQCKCKDSFFGAFCERSPGSNALCSFYEPCVSCLVRLKQGQACNDQAKLCSANDVPFLVEYVSTLPDPPAAVCLFRVSNSDGQVCDHQFSYKVETNFDDDEHRSSLRVKLQPCERPMSAGAVGLGIVGFTFLLGFLALMAFKGVTTLKDRREFARFENELRNTKYAENTSPLYKPATTSYEVPQQVRQSGGGGGINDFGMSDI